MMNEAKNLGKMIKDSVKPMNLGGIFNGEMIKAPIGPWETLQPLNIKGELTEMKKELVIENTAEGLDHLTEMLAAAATLNLQAEAESFSAYSFGVKCTKYKVNIFRLVEKPVNKIGPDEFKKAPYDDPND